MPRLPNSQRSSVKCGEKLPLKQRVDSTLSTRKTKVNMNRTKPNTKKLTARLKGKKRKFQRKKNERRNDYWSSIFL